MTHATRMFPATPQRTAFSLLGRSGAEHGARDRVRRRDGEAEVRRRPEDGRRGVVWAAKPRGGSSLAIRVPSVLMIRQPPA